MIKSWYLHVRDETMAPARMISFIEEHAANCDVCQLDPDLRGEIVRITELVLPESKIPKAVRQRSGLDDELEVDDDDVDVEYKDEEEVDESLDEEVEDEEDLDLDDDLTSEIEKP